MSGSSLYLSTVVRRVSYLLLNVQAVYMKIGLPDPEMLQNFGNYVPVDITQNPRRLKSSTARY
jgi:hypothetical protein